MDCRLSSLSALSLRVSAVFRFMLESSRLSASSSAGGDCILIIVWAAQQQ